MGSLGSTGIPMVQQVPEVYSQTDVDPTIRKRTRPMQVIVIGMPRTGTMSIRAALDRLGYRVFHITNIYYNPRDATMWSEALEAKYGPGGPGKCSFTREQWDMLLGEFNACLDNPCCAFIPELIEAYPEAKVIISYRDADKWFASFSRTIMAFSTSWFVWPIFLEPSSRPLTRLWNGLSTAWGGTGEKEALVARYNQFYDEARNAAPKDRCLEWKLTDGWGPLCEFLGQPVPPETEPFPHVNDQDQFHANLQQVRKRSLDRLTESVVKWGAISIAAGLLYQRYMRS